MVTWVVESYLSLAITFLSEELANILLGDDAGVYGFTDIEASAVVAIAQGSRVRITRTGGSLAFPQEAWGQAMDKDKELLTSLSVYFNKRGHVCSVGSGLNDLLSFEAQFPMLKCAHVYTCFSREEFITKLRNYTVINIPPKERLDFFHLYIGGSTYRVNGLSAIPSILLATIGKDAVTRLQGVSENLRMPELVLELLLTPGGRVVVDALKQQGDLDLLVDRACNNTLKKVAL